MALAAMTHSALDCSGHSGGLSSGAIGPYGGWFFISLQLVTLCMGYTCAVPVMACYGHTLCYFHAVSFSGLAAWHLHCSSEQYS